MLISRRTFLLERMESIVVRRLKAEIRRLKARCRQLEGNQKSPHDPLTGVLTREHFDGIVEKLLGSRHRRVRENDEHIALVMIDLDYFKSVNDTYGHPAGDEVLRSFGEISGELLRENDLVCRRGGDEFMILFRGANDAAIPVIVEKLRKKFESTAFTFHHGVKKTARIHPSFSFGVASYGGRGDSFAKMSARADKNLYVEKRERKRAS